RRDGLRKAHEFSDQHRQRDGRRYRSPRRRSTAPGERPVRDYSRMGDPPYRSPARERAGEDRMRPRAGRAAPPPPRRRRRISPALRHAMPWAMVVVLAFGVYGGVALSRLPTGQAILTGAADRALAASAALGLVVGDIEVEG